MKSITSNLCHVANDIDFQTKELQVTFNLDCMHKIIGGAYHVEPAYFGGAGTGKTNSASKACSLHDVRNVFMEEFFPTTSHGYSKLGVRLRDCKVRLGGFLPTHIGEEEFTLGKYRKGVKTSPSECIC